MTLGNQDSRSNGLVASVDWIAFTSTVFTSSEEMMNFLGYFAGDFQEMPKGAHGYRKMHRLKGFPVTILSDGTPDMGVHVIISGSAIKDVLEHFRRNSMSAESPFTSEMVPVVTDFDNSVMVEFLQQVKYYGWFTRLDLAVDDFGAEYFSVEDVRGYLDRQEVVSKFRSFRDTFESTLVGEPTGHTLYLGSRQSEVMLRVYDKQLEQNKKAEKEEDMIREAWVRWELELKNDRANMAVDLLIQRKELGEIVMGILSNYVKIVVLDDSNRSRCSVLPLWEKFIDAVGKLRLFVQQSAKTLKEKKSWLVRQCLPTIAGVIIADGGSFDIITEHFYDAVLRMNGHLRQLVTQANPDWEQCLDVF